MTARHWTNDWELFSESICSAWNAGLSDQQVSEKHTGQRVRWRGKIATIEDLYRYKSVRIEMPEIVCQLNDGRRVNSVFLYLSALSENTALTGIQ
jgi:hypothetical protein